MSDYLFCSRLHCRKKTCERHQENMNDIAAPAFVDIRNLLNTEYCPYSKKYIGEKLCEK